MQNYVIELSKYFIIICLTFYTFESFLIFRMKTEGQKRRFYVGQMILLFFFQFFCFLSLALRSGNMNYMFLYAFVQVFLFSVMSLTHMIYEKINRLILNNMCLLLGTGFVILSRISYNRAVRQLSIAVISFVICLLIPYILQNAAIIKRLKWSYGVIGVAALGIVLILGEMTHGSKITYSIGQITFQPSELVKLLFVFYLAASLSIDSSFKNIAVTTVMAGAHVLILVVSKDLGSALIFFIAFLVLVFVASRNWIYLVLGALGGAACSVIAYYLFSHVRVRVLAWLNPWDYIDSTGYQITQSLFAIGSGSWFGMGLFGGTPDDIPFVSADFIFSAICEEMGVITGLCIILICVSCFIMAMDIASRCKDRFYQLVAIGIGTIYIFQVFLTIGGGIKFIPLTGVTLPFVSYGGSSVFTSMGMFYLLMGISIIKDEGGKKVVVKRNIQTKRPTQIVRSKEE